MTLLMYCSLCAHSYIYMEAKEWWKMGKAGEQCNYHSHYYMSTLLSGVCGEIVSLDC